MATKFGMSGGIPERRVRPILDAIDSRQFKNAYKLVQALLTKHPDYPYALALKALILDRMGRSDDALSTCLNAKKCLCLDGSGLIDDITLSTLQIVSQRLGRLDLATSCYEDVCGKCTNKGLMIGLFSCYVREYSFVKQQQIAIKMYKAFGEEIFLFWAVCSIQLQVIHGEGGEKLLRLAEGLLRKHVQSHGLHDAEVLLIYTSILEQQAKYADAIEILSGKFGTVPMMEVDLLRMQGKFFARAGDFTAAAVVFQKIIIQCPDDWDGFLCWLSCLSEDKSRFCSSGVGDGADPSLVHFGIKELNRRLSSALARLQELQSETGGGDLMRCPHLGALEIQRRLKVYCGGDDGDLTDGILQYFTRSLPLDEMLAHTLFCEIPCRFGHLACFASDVKAFLDALRPDEKAQLLDKLVSIRHVSPVRPLKSLGQRTTIFRLRDMLGNAVSLQGTVAHVVEMVDVYFRNLHLSKDLDRQESIHGEDLLSMSSHLLVKLFWRTRDVGYLFEAIAVLEFGLAIRSHVWQYKILLVHLCHSLGAVSCSYEWYKRLDVKNILSESLLHHVLYELLQSPLRDESDSVVNEYLRFIDDHLRESADLTFLAYQHQNYSKVIEFVRFRRRLQCSGQYLRLKIEESITRLKQSVDTLDEEDWLDRIPDGETALQLGRERMTLNEDLRTRPWWTPIFFENILAQPFQEISCYCSSVDSGEMERKWEARVRRNLERRSLLPRLIYLSVHHVLSSSSPRNDDRTTNGSSSASASPDVSQELERLLHSCVFLSGGASIGAAAALRELVRVSSGDASREILDADPVYCLTFVVFYNALRSFGPRKEEDGNGVSWRVVDSLLSICLSDLISPTDLITRYRIRFPNLVMLVTECLAWHGLIIRSYFRLSSSTGKRKKKGGVAEIAAAASFQAGEVRNSIASLCSALERVIAWIGEEMARLVECADPLLAHVRRRDGDAPGRVLDALEMGIASVDESQVGGDVAAVLRRWNPSDVTRGIEAGYVRVLSEFLRICDVKLKRMVVLKHKIFLLQT